MIRTFTKEFLRSVIGYGDGPGDDVELIYDNVTGNSRWAIHHEIVFKLTNGGVPLFFKTYYQVGATEQQDESPWEYDKTIDCIEVEPVVKSVTVYVPLGKKG